MQSNNLNDSLIPQITEEDANRIMTLLKDNLSEITSNPTPGTRFANGEIYLSHCSNGIQTPNNERSDYYALEVRHHRLALKIYGLIIDKDGSIAYDDASVTMPTAGDLLVVRLA